MRTVPRPRLPHLNHETTRHGTLVWYVRVGKGPRIRLRDEYGSPEFMEAYRLAISGRPAPDKGAAVKPGTFAWLMRQYMVSAEWSDLSPGTRRSRGNILKTVETKAGDRAIKAFTPAVILHGRDLRQATPHAANNYMKAMRGVFAWAFGRGLVKPDPTAGIAKLKANATGGFHTWTEDEVARFEAHWKTGTRERLALDILLYTGLRRGDATRLGRQHVAKGVITIRTEKTGREVVIPLLPPLAASIAATKTGDLTFLVTDRGTGFVKESFGNWFRRACVEAGVPGSAHGLRKAGATRAAENGATEAQMNAVFGWAPGSRESATYIQKANQARMAASAMHTLLSGQAKNETARTLSPGAGDIEKTIDETGT